MLALQRFYTALHHFENLPISLHKQAQQRFHMNLAVCAVLQTLHYLLQPHIFLYLFTLFEMSHGCVENCTKPMTATIFCTAGTGLELLLDILKWEM